MEHCNCAPSRTFHKHNHECDYFTEVSMFDGKEAAFCEQLYCLQQREDFSLSSFEGVLDEIRSNVAEVCPSFLVHSKACHSDQLICWFRSFIKPKNLWRLVVEKSDLIGKLNQIKNYFLFARGELFLEFIDRIDACLSSPPISSTEHGRSQFSVI